MKVRNKEDIQKIYLFLGASILKNQPIKELIDPEVAGNVWKQTVAIADKYYQPGKFTTFAAYEWTSTPDIRIENGAANQPVVFRGNSDKFALITTSYFETAELKRRVNE